MKDTFTLNPIPSRIITTLVIHCADTPNGRDDDIHDIDQWHAHPKFNFRREDDAKARWRPDLHSVGYHYVITVQGDTQQGRHPQEQGAHAYPHNARSLGVCMMGADRFTPEQWTALKRLVLALTQEHPDLEVIGHHDVNPDKRCPGFDVAAWLANDMEALPHHVLGGAQ